MAGLNELRYPAKSHRKLVKLPTESARLAEFFGIMIGDGGINNPWQANVTLNTEADADYIKFVSDLMHALFGSMPRIMRRKNQKATIVSFASTSVVDFLVEKGLRRGNKLAQGLQIPDWILNRNTYKIACVRGLVDTDGCLILHKHTVLGREYRNLYLSFSSRSRELLEQTAQILFELGIQVHFAGDGEEINVYSKKDVERYLQKVGSSNGRLLKVYQNWRGG